jgi:hypothetical protein
LEGRSVIRLAEVADAFVPDLEAQYGDRLLPGQRNALSAILRCRTEACGTAAIHCHDCEHADSFPLSCGHRACPQCQNEAIEQWLQRQRAKLLPVDYYLITFTLPVQLHALVYANQREAYDLLIKLAWQTLAEFGLNDKTLRGKLGATAVLHTHSRALDFHPHVHIVVPAGAIDPVHNRWRTKQGKFLFPEKALAKVFRAKWFQAMKAHDWKVRAQLPQTWIVDCAWVGTGEKALLYLGRYLYRGVLAEKNILACEHGEVTFRYTDNSGAIRTRTLPGADFLWLVLQHVLPKGFRRTRDYGFLHGNCKRLIQRLHLLLRLCLPEPKEKPPLCCRQCGGVLTFAVIPYPRNRKPPDRPAAKLLEMPM